MKGFMSKDGRTVSKGQKVAVYRNLHDNCWSILDVSSDLVLGHAYHVTLEGLEKPRRKNMRSTFHVIEGGRLRVIAEQSKNVHAYVVGYLVACEFVELETRIYYNPYKVQTFVNADTGSAVYHADAVSMNIVNSVVTAKNAREVF